MMIWLRAMYTSVRHYLIGAIAIAFVILAGVIKHKSRQVKVAKKEVAVQKGRAEAVVKVVEQIADTHVAVAKVEEEAITVEKFNETAKKSGVRPTGDFGDPRVRKYIR